MVMMITVYDDFYSITYFNFLCYDEIKNLFDEDILLLIIIWCNNIMGTEKIYFVFQNDTRRNNKWQGYSQIV